MLVQVLQEHDLAERPLQGANGGAGAATASYWARSASPVPAQQRRPLLRAQPAARARAPGRPWRSETRRKFSSAPQPPLSCDPRPSTPRHTPGRGVSSTPARQQRPRPRRPAGPRGASTPATPATHPLAQLRLDLVLLEDVRVDVLLLAAPHPGGGTLTASRECSLHDCRTCCGGAGCTGWHCCVHAAQVGGGSGGAGRAAAGHTERTLLCKQPSKMSIAVVGATGAIGSTLIRQVRWAPLAGAGRAGSGAACCERALSHPHSLAGPGTGLRARGCAGRAAEGVAPAVHVVCTACAAMGG